MTSVLALLLVTAAAQQDALPLKEGYTWTYDCKITKDMGVLEQKKATVVCTVKGQDKSKLWNLLWTETIEGDKPNPKYEFKVKSGTNTIEVLQASGMELWLLPADLKAKGKRAKVKSATGDVAVECVNKGEEPIDTPSGKHKAVKITASWSAAKYDVSSSVWYVKQLGAVKIVSVVEIKAGAKEQNRTEYQMLLRSFEKEPPKPPEEPKPSEEPKPPEKPPKEGDK